MPMDKESFMNGNLGLGMAIPEEATAELGPLPHLIPTITREQRDAEVCGWNPCPPCPYKVMLGATLICSWWKWI